MKKKILLYCAATVAYFLCVHLIWGLDSEVTLGCAIGLYIGIIMTIVAGPRGPYEGPSPWAMTCPHCGGKLNYTRYSQSVCNVCRTKL